jgi:hypothetical protein
MAHHFQVDGVLLDRAGAALARHDALYWVVGGAGAGKTTVCRMLSAQTGLLVYDMDAHVYGDYHGRFDPPRHPVNAAWAAADDRLAWLLDMSWDEFDGFNRAALPEYLDLLAEDLGDLEPGGGLLIDGGICNPGLLAQVLSPRQIVCLSARHASSERVWEHDGERAGMKAAVGQLRDPEACWRRFLEFDRRITHGMVNESRAAGIPVVEWAEDTTVAQVVEVIVACWGLRKRS